MLSRFAPLFQFQIPTSVLLHCYASGNCNQKTNNSYVEATVELGTVELRQEADIELAKKVDVELPREVDVEVGKDIYIEAEPVRVDTKLDTSGN
jgi:hypothetical protein